jgi:hypothetical protein
MQVQNDPLLEGDDELIADLGRALRWAAVGYGLVGVVIAWFVALSIGLGLDEHRSYAWAAGITIVIIAVAVWYLTSIDRIYSDGASYRASKTNRGLAALDREVVVGLRGEIGKWLGSAIAGLVVITFVTAIVVTASGSEELGWPWFFVGITLVIAYAFGYVSLHAHLLDKARDAAVAVEYDDE